jgi:3-oxoadipate enol-lactonase
MPDTTPTISEFAEIDGAQIYYEVAGAGHPLLLIHAGVADSRMWDDQWALFAQHYRVIRLDMAGYGQSQVPNRPFASHAQVAQLLTLLGAERAHVVGVSWGGRVALDFALVYPQMLDALVLVCPSVSGEEPAEDVQRFGEEEERLIELGDLDAASELNVRTWVDGPHRGPEQVDPSVRDRVRMMQHLAFTIPEPEGAALIRLDPPAIGRLAEVRSRTLVVVGDLDIDEKVAMAKRAANEIPGAQLITFHGTAHMLTMERPEEFGRAVLDFLGVARA